MEKPSFHSNLSNVMNNSYWTKRDYVKHNKARRALKDKDEKIVAMELDSKSEAPDIAVSVEPTPGRSKVGTTLPVNQDDVLGAPEATRMPGNVDMRQRIVNVQAEAQLPRLVSGPKQKDDILKEYQAQHGKGKVIVTSFKGKLPKTSPQPPTQYELMKSCKMKPDRKKSYSVEDPTIFNVLVFLVGTYLSTTEVLVLSKLNKLCAEVVPEIKRLLKINWKPIVEPRQDYDHQKSISMERVDMATALALRCGLDPGKIFRTFGGEYTGE